MNIKKLLVSGAVAATLLANTVSLAAADTLGKVPLYGPVNNTFTCPTGATEEIDDSQLGRVVVHATENSVEWTVVLRGAQPNTTFDIYTNQDPGDCPTTPTAQVTTNKYGNGYLHFTESRVWGAENFWISAVGGSQVLRSPAVHDAWTGGPSI